MVRDFGDIDLLLPELLDDVGLGNRGLPLHVAHRIETGKLEGGTKSILIDAARRADRSGLALHLDKVRQRLDAGLVVIAANDDGGHRAAASSLTVAEECAERPAPIDRVEKAGIRRHHANFDFA